jgi:hypothetical protein
MNIGLVYYRNLKHRAIALGRFALINREKWVRVSAASPHSHVLKPPFCGMQVAEPGRGNLPILNTDKGDDPARFVLSSQGKDANPWIP